MNKLIIFRKAVVCRCSFATCRFQIFLLTPHSLCRMKTLVLFLAAFPLLVGCNGRQETLFEPLSPESTHITFENTLTETDTLNLLEFTYFYNGGGVGIGDVNNDGLSDLYFTGNQTSSRLYLNKGNLQFEDVTESAGVTTDRWARGVSMVDINADGRLDLYVSVAGTTRRSKMENLLFINQGTDAAGQPTFREQARAYGLADTAHTTQTAFFDYDRDGDLDAYLLTNAIESFSPNLSRPKKTRGEGLSTDRLYRNEGTGPAGHPVFRDVSQEAGITVEGYGLGIAVNDLNLDGWPDVYCANDFVSNDLIWVNNGDGTFTNQAAAYLQHQSYNGMGTDIADINNDGLMDIVVLDMMPEDNKRQKTMAGAMQYDKFVLDTANGYEPQFVRNTLQLNGGMRPVRGSDSTTGKGEMPLFSEIGQLAGVSNTDWSWSALLADFDNDGHRDLFITNGYAKDITDLDYVMYNQEQTGYGERESIRARQRELAKKLPANKLHNYLYRNNGNLTFTDQSDAWGLSLPTLSNGAAYADLDNDGDLDLVINNINEPAGIYRNNAADWQKARPEKESPRHFLRMKLDGPAANRAGLGAKIRLRTGGNTQTHEHTVYRGFQSTVEPAIHFGLGPVTAVDSVEITWPDGRYQLLRHVKADQVLTLQYRNAGERPSPAAPTPAPLLAEVSTTLGIDYAHRENGFVDFKGKPLLHQQYSRNGPGLAVGDVNGDGLEDFFVGGASGLSGKLFLQRQQPGAAPAFTGTSLDGVGKEEEDMGALLFDAEGDGDLDLYVVSGGSEFASRTHLYQDRLYKNDGKGTFSRDTTALPRETGSGSVVTAADYDRDGDLDLFVGGRVSPDVYPYVPRSYLLRNDRGTFREVSSEMAGGLQSVGMVTAALWTDFDGDGWVDMVVAGEWMPLRFFKNGGGKLTEVTASTGLPNTAGWWNSLAAGDFDNDGDTDYVAGNLGRNSKYKASPEEPVCLYAYDFDKNGTVDPVLCYYLPAEDGKRASFPTHSRDEFLRQMTSLRKQFTQYAAYAVTRTEDLFSEDDLEKAFLVKSEHFQTSYFENRGGGQFSMKPLPIQAQFAPVFGMVASDYNGDGNLDLLLSGNSYAPEVQTGQYDALPGLYLRGDGKGNFTPIPAAASGLLVTGDAKGMAELVLADGRPLLLAAVNSGKLKAFSPSKDGFATGIRMLPLEPDDAYAEVTFADGRKRRQECYYGSTYLSQSTRTLCLPPTVRSVSVVSYAGKRRQVNLTTGAWLSGAQAGRTGALHAMARQ